VAGGELPVEQAPDVPQTGLAHRPYEISTVASRGYGIRVTDIDTGREYVTHLVHANDTLPASVTDDFHTLRDDQRRVRIQVMEQAGAVESDELGHNTAVAEGTLRIPPGKPARWPFQCVFTLDTSGLLTVVATERETGERIEISVQIGGLSQEAVDEARVAMSRQRIG
jgi:molecular chaperone DnaK (HSP70)